MMPAPRRPRSPDPVERGRVDHHRPTIMAMNVLIQTTAVTLTNSSHHAPDVPYSAHLVHSHSWVGTERFCSRSPELATFRRIRECDRRSGRGSPRHQCTRSSATSWGYTTWAMAGSGSVCGRPTENGCVWRQASRSWPPRPRLPYWPGGSRRVHRPRGPSPGPADPLADLGCGPLARTPRYVAVKARDVR
jgi:hypothetical protein